MTLNLAREIDTFETVTILDTLGESLVYTDEDGVTDTIDLGYLETETNITDTLTTNGNQIATYTNEEDVAAGIYETITSQTYDETTGCLLYTSPSPRDRG